MRHWVAVLLGLLALSLALAPQPPPPRHSVRLLPFYSSPLSSGVTVVEVYGLPRYTGRGVVVAVLDTGVDYTHPDLRHAVKLLASFTVRTRDGRPLVWVVGLNGTLDDARSFDETVKRSAGAYAWLDEHGHGTHVSGIIAGDGSLSGGAIRGLAPGASLWVVKVLGADGTGSVKDLIDALLWLARMMDAGYQVDVVNLSLGVEDREEGERVASACAELVRRGAIVVAAAGNEGTAGAIDYPARARGIIAATAVDRSGRRAPFASMGAPWIDKPDYAALGVDVLSTAPTYPSRLGQTAYAALSGTSMATAVLSGIAALWVEAVGRAAALQAMEASALPASPVGAGRTWSIGLGYAVPPGARETFIGSSG
ncbi:MAG: S8 family serine peptidase [Conexivisphaera sp.]